MEKRPPSKRFWMVPFTVLATKGLLRDDRMRRRVMTLALMAAVVMLFAGLTILRTWLEPHDHPWRFILFWFACAWITLLLILLALLDILIVRAQARAARRAFREQFSKPTQKAEDE